MTESAVLRLRDFQPRPIKILDDQVVNQIAAGEVVERPSSVVKELVENALDAQATEITIMIANGGKTAIEVLDNGFGMSKEDALLAVQRFGTSKIDQAADLQSITTLGFRGEALPSIAAISEVTLLAKRAGFPGVELSLSGGEERYVREATVPEGTRISVRNMFFNVPARRKFLKSEAAETSSVKSLVRDLALSFPDVRFRLLVDGGELLRFAPAPDFFSRAMQTALAGEKPLRVDYEHRTRSGAIVVNAIISQPVESVAHAHRLRLLVNGRAVRDRLLLRAVRDAYGNFLKGGKYPQGVVRLEVPFADVDVNVHPQKSEVRFREPSAVFSAIVVGIGRALQRVNPEAFLQETMKSQAFEPWKQGSPAPISFSLDPANPVPEEAQSNMWSTSDSSVESHIVNTELPSSLQEFRYLGQVFHCYLILERGELVALVDMHAAHERVTFFRLKSQFVRGGIDRQGLLIPEVVELADEELLRAQESLDEFGRLGFEVELFGDNTIVIRSVPAILARSSARALILDLLSRGEAGSWGKLVGDRCDSALARLACHGSVRSGRDLEREEVYALLASLEAAEQSGFCPHGRPVIRFLSKIEMEEMFGRRV